MKNFRSLEVREAYRLGGSREKRIMTEGKKKVYYECGRKYISFSTETREAIFEVDTKMWIA